VGGGQQRGFEPEFSAGGCWALFPVRGVLCVSRGGAIETSLDGYGSEIGRGRRAIHSGTSRQCAQVCRPHMPHQRKIIPVARGMRTEAGCTGRFSSPPKNPLSPRNKQTTGLGDAAPPRQDSPIRKRQSKYYGGTGGHSHAQWDWPLTRDGIALRFSSTSSSFLRPSRRRWICCNRTSPRREKGEGGEKEVDENSTFGRPLTF
jgi:hypothetical protein